jgi:hypothetical protein
MQGIFEIIGLWRTYLTSFHNKTILHVTAWKVTIPVYRRTLCVMNTICTQRIYDTLLFCYLHTKKKSGDHERKIIAPEITNQLSKHSTSPTAFNSGITQKLAISS